MTRTACTETEFDAMLHKFQPGYRAACTVHRTFKNKPFDLAAYPYLEQPLIDEAQVIVCKKSTQCGWTEMLLAKMLGEMELGRFVFWVLPTAVIKNRFVKNRFDRTVAYTEYYHRLLRGEETRMRADRSASMSLKHYADGGAAFVGSNAMSGFGEFPADDGVVDEYDYCEPDNMPMVEERLSDSEVRKRLYGGQPTIEGTGVSKMYKDSCRWRWVIHARCGHAIFPDWYAHVVRKVDELKYEVRDREWNGVHGRHDARLICDRCEKPVDRYAPGEWIAEEPANPVSGYHFSKLFTTKMLINEILDRFDKGLTNPSVMQRFENADLGLAHSARGSKIQREDLELCLGDYGQGRCEGSCVVGVDVGAVLHVMVGELQSNAAVRVVWLGTVVGTADNLGDLRLLLARYRVAMGVIDELPETRMSRRLAYSSRGWWMCRYAEGKRDLPDPRAKVISVDRTVQLDYVNEAVLLGKDRITFPGDALAVEGFVEHMTALTRVYDKELHKGEGGYTWAGDEPDHFMHACGYMLLAKRYILRR